METKYEVRSIFDEVIWGRHFNCVRSGDKWGLQNAKTGILDLSCVYERISPQPRSNRTFLTVLRRVSRTYTPKINRD